MTFKYFLDLRSEILEIISGVKNSGGGIQWDDSTPNYIIKGRLENLLRNHLKGAREFGIYIVTRHSNCQNPKHVDYPTSNTYGLNIPHKGAGYFWGKGQLYQGNRFEICPCSSDNAPTMHWVIDDIVFEEMADHDLCKRLEEILNDISQAIDAAHDKRSRSGIREHLLRALLLINDQLLPESMDVYIEKKLRQERRLI